MKNHVPLDDLEIYQLSVEIGTIVWDLIVGWNSLAQKTVGEQFVRAADSIAANIAEGYGRYFFKEQNNSVITAVAPCWNQKPGQLRQEIAS